MSKYIQREPTTMRLEYFWRDRRGNGQRFIYKLKDYFRSIKHAWTRAWHGYDDIDVFSLGFRLCERLQDQLKEFHQYHSEIVDAPEVDEVVLRIIDLLEYGTEEEKAQKELFPNVEESLHDLFGFSFMAHDYTGKQLIEASDYSDAKVQEAFNLLGKYMGRLWY